MKFSERLRKLRKEKGLTQKELSLRINIPLRSIINYENSQREPNAKAMAALEAFFGVSARYLLGETDELTQQASERKAGISIMQSDEKEGVSMDEKIFFKALYDFVIRASNGGATTEEVKVLPEVAQIVISYASFSSETKQFTQHARPQDTSGI